MLPETRAAFLKLVTACDPVTFHIAPFGGVRTEADTSLILAYRRADYEAHFALRAPEDRPSIESWRPIAPYGHSYHNYGAAFDVTLDELYGYTHDFALSECLGARAQEVGLRWGGNFPANRIDLPHFELDVSLDEARRQWNAAGPHAPTGAASWLAISIVLAIAFVLAVLFRSGV